MNFGYCLIACKILKLLCFFLLVLVRFLNFCVSCKCRNLRVLDLQENYVEDQSGYWLSHFPESCTSLEVLNLACLEGEVNSSVLERLVARCPNLRTLRLNQAVPLEKLANILRRAPQLVDLGTGAFAADPRQELYSKLANAFEGSKSLKSLSGFWSVVPSYLPAIYSVCAGLTSLNLSYATIQSAELVNLISQCHNLQRLLVCPFISTMTTTAVLCPFWQFAEIISFRIIGFFFLVCSSIHFTICCELADEDIDCVICFSSFLLLNLHKFGNDDCLAQVI